ncbi:hypothetical protein MANES_08G102611v8 [Manihot esculenta]|uniref:Uncharacterized protein n=1 Tax=Manihot esculenta TaxID=3983 RepID=A0ACB7H9S5_MANES|nr:hypothetical protein MANES_08G102611v8 [Manihot esculenta]
MRFNEFKPGELMGVINVRKKFPDALRSSSVFLVELLREKGRTHIPSPCVAASPPLQFGTGHDCCHFVIMAMLLLVHLVEDFMAFQTLWCVDICTFGLKFFLFV